MFSLIITIISIVLVVAILAATMYNGGDTYGEGKAAAEAAKIHNHGQQLLAASEFFYNDNGRYPNSVQDLISGGYLKSMPMASIVQPAVADPAGWAMPTAGIPVYQLQRPIDVELCKQVNVRGSLNADGVLRVPYSELRMQCFGSDQADLRVLVSKNSEQLSLALGDAVRVGLPGSEDAAEWLALPSKPVSGTTPPITPEPEPEPEPVFSSYLIDGNGNAVNSLMFGDVVQFGAQTHSLFLGNNGDTAMTLSIAPNVSGAGFVIQNSTCGAGQTIAPQSSCQFQVAAITATMGDFNGTLSFGFSQLGSESLNVTSTIRGSYGEWSESSLTMTAATAGTAVTRTVSFTNRGNASGNFTFSAPNGLTVTPGCSNLAAGTSCSLTVTYVNPQSGSPINGVITVSGGTQATSGLTVSASAPASARKVEYLVNGVVTNYVDLGDFQTGNLIGYTRKGIDLTIRNVGTEAVGIWEDSYNTAYNDDWSSDTCTGDDLQPGASCRVQIRVGVDTPGEEMRRFTLSHDDGYGNLLPVDQPVFNIRVNGLPSESLQITVDGVNTPYHPAANVTIPVGTSKLFRYHSIGTGALRMSHLTFPSSGYAVSENTCVIDANINSGQSCQFRVTNNSGSTTQIMARFWGYGAAYLINLRN